jgi:hypothetical protein
MATKNQITGGGFQDALGNVLAGGYLVFELSQDAQVNGTTQIAAGYTVRINLDSSGNVATSPAQSIWPNDVLSPNGTFYLVSAYSAIGQLVWGPNAQQVLSSPSPYNIGVWVPSSVNLGLGGGGGASILLQTNGAANGSQIKLNLVSGANIQLTDNGTGSVTIRTTPATSVANNVPSFSNTTGTLQDSGIDILDVVLRSTNNQFGNTIQTFGLSGSGEVQISNNGITGIAPGLATTFTISTTSGAATFIGGISATDMNMSNTFNHSPGSPANILYWALPPSGANVVSFGRPYQGGGADPTSTGLFNNSGGMLLVDDNAPLTSFSSVGITWNAKDVLIAQAAPTSSATASNLSTPVVIGGTTYYVRLSSTP